MKTAKLFKNGQSQAVRLPKEFRFDGDEVFVRRVGNAVLLIPQKGTWTDFRDNLKMFASDFPSARNQPKRQKRENPFK